MFASTFATRPPTEQLPHSMSRYYETLVTISLVLCVTFSACLF